MYAKYFKRGIDFILSLCALIGLSPVLLILMILGTVFMGGNPFFTQERPGKAEKIFKLIKFRTMSDKKDKDGNLLPDELRLNKYGKFLRASSLDELPEGATIIMSNSVADHGRMLSLLQTEGLITLDSNVDASVATVEDIIENPKNLTFKTDIDPGMLVTVYEQNEGDAVLINTNYALDGGLNPMTDSIAMEGSESPYVNIIAVNSGDENRDDIKTLVEVLRSKEIQDFIVETYAGAVVPVSE